MATSFPETSEEARVNDKAKVKFFVTGEWGKNKAGCDGGKEIRGGGRKGAHRLPISTPSVGRGLGPPPGM